MPIERHRATGWGVFGLKRHVKGGLQECVRATALSGLGLPARILGLSEHGKTADNAAAAPDKGADGNTAHASALRASIASLFFRCISHSRRPISSGGYSRMSSSMPLSNMRTIFSSRRSMLFGFQTEPTATREIS